MSLSHIHEIAQLMHDSRLIPGLIPLSLTEEEEFARLMEYEDDSDLDEDLPPLGLSNESRYAPPNIIQSYTAILLLGLLGDDFSRLDRKSMIRFLARCQNDDGS